MVVVSDFFKMLKFWFNLVHRHSIHIALAIVEQVSKGFFSRETRHQILMFAQLTKRFLEGELVMIHLKIVLWWDLLTEFSIQIIHQFLSTSWYSSAFNFGGSLEQVIVIWYSKCGIESLHHSSNTVFGDWYGFTVGILAMARQMEQHKYQINHNRCVHMIAVWW